MLVTDKQYYMENFLVERLDLMCDRVTKYNFDNLILIDGNEGYGKTNLGAGVCYYVSQKTGRPFGIDNIFFDADSLLKFATSTEKQIILFDEAAIALLASESFNKLQITLIKMMMIARKKNHFYVFIIPEVFSLKRYIIRRAIALLRVYSRDEITRGRFAYFTKDSKDSLYQHFRKSGDAAYAQYYNFAGSFPDILSQIVDESAYDIKKDTCIKSLGQPNANNDEILALKEENRRLKMLYASIPGITQQKLAEHAHISKRTLQRWKNTENLDLMEPEKRLRQGDTILLDGVTTHETLDEEVLDANPNKNEMEVTIK